MIEAIRNGSVATWKHFNLHGEFDFSDERMVDTMGLADYFEFYNSERFHQSLDYLTPDAVYRTGNGGGAKIVDKFSEKETSRPKSEVESGQRRSAASDGLPS